MRWIDVVVHGAVGVALIISVTVLGVTRVLDGNQVLTALIAGGGATAVLSLSDRIIYGPIQPPARRRAAR